MPKTMAVKITEANYDIAVACLRAGFAANWPKSETLGAFLVINELKSIEASDSGISHREPPLLVISNSWMDAERFNSTYRFIDPKQKGNTFAEVEKI